MRRNFERVIATVYPRVRHQRCWVHKMRNILEEVRRRDQAQLKAEAQKIYLAKNAAAAQKAFERFRFHWRSRYPAMVRQFEPYLSELLHFFALPPHLWRRLRTTDVIERCFAEVRRRTRPMVVWSNIESVEQIIYAIFSRFNEDWEAHTLKGSPALITVSEPVNRVVTKMSNRCNFLTASPDWKEHFLTPEFLRFWPIAEFIRFGCGGRV